MPQLAYKIRRLIRAVLPGPGFLTVDGSIIPLPEKRWCGPEFKNDRFYLKSAEEEARRLRDNFKCSNVSRVLDVGCGQGRLPIGILRVMGDVDYTGIDIDGPSVSWCNEHIRRHHPTFKFEHLNLYNERYNKDGEKIDDQFHFDIEDKSSDVVYLFSVFSHTTEDDMKVYLREFRRILDDVGNVFFTTFVEEDVPDVSVNPENYRLKCSGPLHVVRYNRDYLFSLVGELGYTVVNFTHATEADGQSAIYLAKGQM